MQIGSNISIHEYWERVLAIAAKLPDVVTVISEGDDRTGARAGAVCLCDAKTAAQLLFARTHRVATEQEIADHEKAQSVERTRLTEIEYKRKQNFALPSELTDLIRMAVKGATQEEVNTGEENSKPSEKHRAKEAR
jgi:hypothetical protein